LSIDKVSDEVRQSLSPVREKRKPLQFNSLASQLFVAQILSPFKKIQLCFLRNQKIKFDEIYTKVLVFIVPKSIFILLIEYIFIIYLFRVININNNFYNQIKLKEV
jgi:hypothetical protein